MDLQEISDRLAIQDLLARYSWAVDTADWDVLDRTFTPDAHLDYSASGGFAGPYDEARAWLEATLPGPFATLMHLLGLPVIDITGDTATVHAYLDNPMRMHDGPGGARMVEIGAIYHEELVRTPDGWRISSLRQELKWHRGLVD